MPTPRQSFDHKLDAIKGWFDLNSLDFAAKLSANVTFDTVFAGRVVHRNTDGEFEMGVAGTQMAIFLRQSSDDPDVANDGGDQWKGTIPNGVMSGLVATGGYELESTEFDTTLDYASNDVLKATADNADEDVGGVLSNDAVVYTDAVCGVVSRGVLTNVHKKQVLAFWPVYLPPIP